MGNSDVVRMGGIRSGAAAAWRNRRVVRLFRIPLEVGSCDHGELAVRVPTAPNFRGTHFIPRSQGESRIEGWRRRDTGNARAHRAKARSRTAEFRLSDSRASYD